MSVANQPLETALPFHRVLPSTRTTSTTFGQNQGSIPIKGGDTQRVSLGFFVSVANQPLETALPFHRVLRAVLATRTTKAQNLGSGLRRQQNPPSLYPQKRKPPPGKLGGGF